MFKFVVLFAFLSLCRPESFLPASDPKLSGRIIGGHKASIKDFPYQVLIQSYGLPHCGGTLYSSSVVITAAHCVRDAEPKYIKIRAGSTYSESGGSLVDAKSIIIHPDYESKSKANDLALIKLAKHLELSNTIHPIELISEVPAEGTPAVISGWGIENFYKKELAPGYLKSAHLKIISQLNCSSDKYKYGTEHILPMMICAAGDNQDSCQGDSGGPLVVNGKLAGVISWGFGCAESIFPGAYTNVALFRSWIIKNA